MMGNEGKLIILETCWDENGVEMLHLSGDASHQHDFLIFRHEFDLTLLDDLSFKWAWSIDCGECSSYGNEAEFEAAFPGVLDSIRSAAEDGTLMVRSYAWDGFRNVPNDVPYKSLS